MVGKHSPRFHVKASDALAERRTQVVRIRYNERPPPRSSWSSSDSTNPLTLSLPCYSNKFNGRAIGQLIHGQRPRKGVAYPVYGWLIGVGYITRSCYPRKRYRDTVYDTQY